MGDNKITGFKMYRIPEITKACIPDTIRGFIPDRLYSNFNFVAIKIFDSGKLIFNAKYSRGPYTYSHPWDTNVREIVADLVCVVPDSGSSQMEIALFSSEDGFTDEDLSNWSENFEKFFVN